MRQLAREGWRLERVVVGVGSIDFVESVDFFLLIWRVSKSWCHRTNFVVSSCRVCGVIVLRLWFELNVMTPLTKKLAITNKNGFCSTYETKACRIAGA